MRLPAMLEKVCRAPPAKTGTGCLRFGSALQLTDEGWIGRRKHDHNLALSKYSGALACGQCGADALARAGPAPPFVHCD
eukprot:1639277-Amphidinium_carterae.1